LAKLEILIVRKELAEKRAEAKRIETLLKSEAKRWGVVKDELSQIRQTFADKRRTKIAGATNEPEFQAEDFIVDEDACVILSAQGWVKRVREVKDLSTTRVREGDSVLGATAGSTRAAVAFFSNQGSAYVSRITDIPQSTGYGDPVQKLFKLGDGEAMVALESFDPRVLEVPEASGEEPEEPFAVAITRQGLGFKFSLRAHRDPSTRAGRKFARLNDGDEIAFVAVLQSDDDVLVAVTSDGHALGVPASELALLAGPGKGTIVIKVPDGERVVGAFLAPSGKGEANVTTEKGKEHRVRAKDVVGSRASRGDALWKRDRPVKVLPPPIEIPNLKPTEEG
jgi:DNA gyrase subunit A